MLHEQSNAVLCKSLHFSHISAVGGVWRQNVKHVIVQRLRPNCITIY